MVYDKVGANKIRTEKAVKWAMWKYIKEIKNDKYNEE